MKSRALIFASAVAGVAVCASLVSASFHSDKAIAEEATSDWRKEYKEINFSVVPSENAKSLSDKYEPLGDKLSKALGVPVKLSVMSDYAGVIEALKSGHVQLGFLTPASYVRAEKVTQGKIEPIGVAAFDHRPNGYYSVLYVRADSPYKTMADVEGKSVAWVDVNSSSGYVIPRYYLSQEGVNVDKHFKKSVMAGSHENAVMSLVNGQVDVAANWWDTEDDTLYLRLVKKGLLPADKVRVLWKSPLMIESPFVIPSGLPEKMKEDIKNALYNVHKDDAEFLTKVFETRVDRIAPVTKKDFEEMVKVVEYSDRLRRTRH